MSATPTDTPEKTVSAGEDDVRQYMQEIRAYPLLTAEEERELALRCAQGDEEAIRALVNANLRLVVSIAKEYTGRGVPLMDLIQEGSIGLLAAAKKFDYTRELRFSTYATKWIRQSVGRCLAQHSGVIRVPTHTGEKMRKVLATQNRLTQELERPPTEAEIAESTGLTAEQVRKLLDLVPETCSLDAPTGEDGDTSLGGLLRDSTVEAPEKEVVRQELETTMQTLLDQLPERQRKLVSMRFGLEDGVCHSLDEIGREFGVSRERARQIEGQAMEKLRQMGMKQGLEDFLE